MPVLYDSPPSALIAPAGSTSSKSNVLAAAVAAPSPSASAVLLLWLGGALLLLCLLLRGVRRVHARWPSRGARSMSHPSPPLPWSAPPPQPYEAGAEKQQSPPLSRDPPPRATGRAAAKTWPPPPPMPTISPLEMPGAAPYHYPYFDDRPRDSRDEYYLQSPDQFLFPAGGRTRGPEPGPSGYGPPYQSQYHHNYYYGFPAASPLSAYTSHYPPPKASVLPPLHPDAAYPPVAPAPAPPSNPRTHRRSYSQKIIYPKPLSPPAAPPRDPSASAPDLTRGNLESPPGAGAGVGAGVEVAEEVIVAAEGWRRHTRVYGGGVCLACLESEAEQKMFVAGQGPLLVEGASRGEPVEAAPDAPMEDPARQGGELSRGEREGDARAPTEEQPSAARA